MNVITIAGNLGKNAELRSIPSGEQVLSFSVADSQGRDKGTIWWRCQLWGKRAESLAPYLLQGQQVTVSGTVQERSYTKDGAEHKTMEVRVNDVALQGGKRDEQAQRPSAPAPRPPVRQAAPAASSGFDDMDSDIPF